MNVTSVKAPPARVSETPAPAPRHLDRAWETGVAVAMVMSIAVNAIFGTGTSLSRVGITAAVWAFTMGLSYFRTVSYRAKRQARIEAEAAKLLAG